jgi:hypothetical protein
MSQTNAPALSARKSGSAGRYTVASTVEVAWGERVGVAVDPKKGSMVVLETAQSQTALPAYAVATAVASGKVIPYAALIECVDVDFGELAALKAAISAYEKAQKEKAATPA